MSSPTQLDREPTEIVVPANGGIRQGMVPAHSNGFPLPTARSLSSQRLCVPSLSPAYHHL
jgi:hypothetical protein